MLQETTADGLQPAIIGDAGLGPNSMVDHFRVIRQVGRGGMGEVYLARDMLLGRKVALKVVRTRRGSDGQRFLHEARTIARFSHPHIVTIYAVGEHDGHPYLALEYLEGRSLRDRIDEGPVGLRESLGTGIAVAEALAEAHHHGVLHLDLKPENVVIPHDGRLRVVDFGLSEVVSAVLAPGSEDLPRASTAPLERWGRPDLQGTPPYMAPEQWAQEEIGSPADIWSLGVILHELAAGRRPYEVTSVRDLVALVTGRSAVPSLEGCPGISPRHVALVQSCLDKDAPRRPSAAEAAETLRELLATARGSSPGEQIPFRGLQSFDEKHAHIFFGREAEVDAFLERIRGAAVLPVVGPSGAGKSSLIQAGVIPRLRDQGPWTVVSLRPGRNPFRVLASRLCAEESITPAAADTPTPVPVHDTDALASRLADSPQLLSLALERIAAARQCRVLLFVDQLEELFTLGQDEQIARRFLEAVCSAADDPHEPMRVVFTLREDFLGRLAGSPRVRDALGHVTLVGPPEREALEEILVEPIRRVDYRYDDPRLVEEMIAAAGNETAALPLLQFTAHLLWERRDRGRRRLTRAAYEALGGVPGAIAAHADGVLEGLPGRALRTTQALLLRLVTAQRTRRVLPMSRLLEGLGGEAEDLVGRLVSARLLSVRKSRDGEDDETEVELAHESLIHGWARLSRWIDRSREELAFLEEMEQTANLWRRRGRREDDLLHGDTLHEALVSLSRCTTAVPEQLRQFIETSRSRQHRQIRRRRWLTALSVAAALVVALVLAVQKHEADGQRREARRRWAEAQRQTARAAMGRGDLLEARATLRGSLETEDSALARALWCRLSKNPLVWRKKVGPVVYGVAFSPDGNTVAAASQDRQVYLVDTVDQKTTTLRGFRDQVLAVAFAPDGKRIAAGTWSGAITVRRLDGAGVIRLTGHTNAVRWVAFSPDGRQLASVGADRTIRVWDLIRGTLGRVLEAPSRVMGLALSPDGKRLATGGVDRRVRVWRLDAARPPQAFSGHRAGVTAVAFSPDGTTLASAGMDRTVRLWRTSDGKALGVLTGHQAGINSLGFSPDGRRLASAGYDRVIRVVDLASGRTEKLLEGHDAPVFGLAFSPDGRLLLSGSQDHSIALWRIDAPVELRVVRGHLGQVHGVDFGPDGRQLATGGEDAAVRLWDVQSGVQQRLLQGHDGRVTAVSFSPDGRFLATAGLDRTVRLWDLRSTYESRVLGSHWAPVYELAFSADGKLLASGANDKRIRIWDVEKAVQRTVLAAHRDAVYGLAFSPDGRSIASASRDRTVRLWDLESGQVTRVLRGHAAEVKGVAFHPDGKQVASASDDGTVRLWDLDSGTAAILGRRSARSYFLGFHPSGQLVGVPHSDGTASLLPIGPGAAASSHSAPRGGEGVLQLHPAAPRQGREDLHARPTTLLRGHRAEVNRLRFSPDGGLAATTSDDGSVRVWRTRDGMPYWRGPAMLGAPPRLLTHRGWIEPGNGRAAAPPVGRKLRAAVEQRGLEARREGSTLCLAASGGQLEIWSISADRRRLAESMPGLRQVVATPEGCVGLSTTEAWIYSHGGLSLRLPATAATWSRGRLLVASGGRILSISAAGTPAGSVPGADGVIALGEVNEWIAMGFADGKIELVPAAGGDRKPGFAFESLPSSPVVRILPGPRQTMIAGYVDGSIGIWHLGNGARLDHSKLHGPVGHLLVEGHRLHAATELGDHMVLDLSAFHLSYCELVRRVWREVPVVWERRSAMLRPPPTAHRCAAK